MRVIDLFVDELDLVELGFEGTTAAATGRPGYHPALLLKIYIYGYLNRIQSSRRLEREAQRNLELMWLTDGSKFKEVNNRDNQMGSASHLLRTINPPRRIAKTNSKPTPLTCPTAAISISQRALPTQSGIGLIGKAAIEYHSGHGVVYFFDPITSASLTNFSRL